jgi:hypothetical protein
MGELVLLDCEGVQAIGDPGHRKHAKMISRMQLIAKRKAWQNSIAIAVPTAVRVEAGWDRTEPAWAFSNRLRIADIPLDTGAADAAARLRMITGVSVAYTHLGAAIASAKADKITIFTSDPHDINKVADGKRVNIVRLLVPVTLTGPVTGTRVHAHPGRIG